MNERLLRWDLHRTWYPLRHFQELLGYLLEDYCRETCKGQLRSVKIYFDIAQKRVGQNRDVHLANSSVK